MQYYAVDRFEGDFAVLTADGRLRTFRRDALPPDTAEGDVLLRTEDGFERCPDRTLDARAEMIRMRQALLQMQEHLEEETN